MKPSRRAALPGLAVIGLGASVMPLDFAVGLAFPAITDAFGLATSDIRWIAVSYVLVYGSLMLGFGALGDRIGYLRVFRAGLVLGALAFALCTFAPTYGWLLAARAMQGVAVALSLSCAPALATLLVDERDRTWALSAFAGTQAIAGVAAPIIGGMLLEAFGWPGVMAFRVPVCLLAWAGLPWLARAAARQTLRAGSGGDTVGSVLLAAGVALMLLGPALLGPGTPIVPSLATGAAGLLAMGLFIARQRRATVPFLPGAVARDTDFLLLNAAACVVQFACFAVPLTIPYYLLRVLDWAPPPVGLMLSVWAIGTLGGSAVAARVVKSIGARAAVIAGAVLAGVGLAGIAFLAQPPSVVAMIVWLIVQGAGLGLFQVAYTDAVIAALPSSVRGVAGSLTMVARTVGVVVAVTTWMWTLQSHEDAGRAAGGDVMAALSQGFHVVVGAAAVAIGVVAVTLAGRLAVRIRRADGRRG